MKKHRIPVPMLVMTWILSFVLCACQPTPDTSVVIDRSQGLSDDYIIPGAQDTPKGLGAPERWQETIRRSDGFVTIEADYEMELPEVYNTPVYAYKPQKRNYVYIQRYSFV